jgi:hypothetical protein
VSVACSPRPAAWLIDFVRYLTKYPIDTDHGRLKARLRPMRGLTRLQSTRVISTGHAFVQNIRRGHYELGVEETVNLRVLAAFDELALAI